MLRSCYQVSRQSELRGNMEQKQQAENAARVRKIIEKVTVFKRMTMWDADAILKVCEFKTYQKGELIYQVGRASVEMLILLQGGLTATADSGAMLGRIAPGTTTGEMGLLTDSPRSANVVATEKSAGFVLKKIDLDKLFERNERLKMQVYENLVSLLCSRLAQANVTIESRVNR